ncbi:MAG: hypothetical protein Q4G04_02665 [bacterium]|nr:hypothetical protein [bacterium]
MKKLKNIFIIIITLLITIDIIINKELVAQTVGFSLNIWITTLIPALFPFFIVSEILINYNITKYLSPIFDKIMNKVFKINGETAIVFLLSIISGFPSGAKNTKMLYDEKIISSSVASKLLTFTHFSNPFFILSTVSIFFLKDAKTGIVILLSHYLSNIVVGIMFRDFCPNNSQIHFLKNEQPQSFGTTLANAINNTINTLFLILGILTCFLIISTLIINKVAISNELAVFIKSILEITQGLQALGTLDISMMLKCIFASMIISFGGLSVHMQVLSIISDTNISYFYFFISRILASAISGILCLIIYPLIF